MSRNEFALIDWIEKQPQSPAGSVLRSIGDDCCVLDPAFAHRLVVTGDLLIEDTHFQRQWMSPYMLGRKAIRVNLSDIAAMGGRPHSCLLSLGLPSPLEENVFESFMRGFLKECSFFGCPLIGGDLSRSEQIVVQVTAFGFIRTGEPLLRSQARSGDSVVVIGDLGRSRLGLRYLQQNPNPQLRLAETRADLKELFEDPLKLACVQAHLLPEILIEPACWLQEQGLANSMIDVSDGLAADLAHVLRRSGVSATLFLDHLDDPMLHSEPQRGEHLLLNGGEDYSLVFTCSDSQRERLETSYPDHFPPYRHIGKLQGGSAQLWVQRGGLNSPYEPEGYDHFP